MAKKINSAGVIFCLFSRDPRRCNGQRSCTLEVSSEFFQEDPCPGTGKYIEAQFHCIGLFIVLFCFFRYTQINLQLLLLLFKTIIKERIELVSLESCNSLSILLKYSSGKSAFISCANRYFSSQIGQ